MNPNFKILRDDTEFQSRKEAARREFLALPADEAQRLIDIGIAGPLNHVPAEPGAFGEGLTDEQDGVVD